MGPNDAHTQTNTLYEYLYTSCLPNSADNEDDNSCSNLCFAESVRGHRLRRVAPVHIRSVSRRPASLAVKIGYMHIRTALNTSDSWSWHPDVSSYWSEQKTWQCDALGRGFWPCHPICCPSDNVYCIFQPPIRDKYIFFNVIYGRNVLGTKGWRCLY